MKKQPKSHIISGRKYLFKWKNPSPMVIDGKKTEIDGYAESPKKRNPVICINPNLPNDRKLHVIIHEIIHASSWASSEKKVEQMAQDIADFLIKSGIKF